LAIIGFDLSVTDGMACGRSRLIHPPQTGAAAHTPGAWIRHFVAYFFRNRSTRPSVSTIFCVPVKNGWQAAQISTRMSFTVDRVLSTLPHAHEIVAS
jgi:hypothetical protein